MILIPQRLFDDAHVHTILRDGNVCILEKQLPTPLLEREGYISNHVVVILLAGEQCIRPQDAEQPIRIEAGQGIFIPRGLYYISDLLPAEGPFHSLLFYFDDRLIQEFLSTVRVTEVTRAEAPGYLQFELVPTLRLFADALRQMYGRQGLRNRSFLDLKILELLHLLNGLQGDQRFANFLFRLTLPKKRHIKTFMEQNFDKPLKIEDYAYLTGRSTTTFRRDFKATFDTTPQQWLKRLRLEKALTLLQDRAMSVGELADAVGYDNVSYFIRSFREAYGLSPKQYRIQWRKGKL